MSKKLKLMLITALCAIMAICTCISASAYASNDDIEKLLSVTGIMSGDQNGNLNLEKEVTRAEFSKMLVSASVYKDSISKTSISTGFSDVSPDHWASPYIRTASQNKWIYGYSNGKFEPSSKIKLEEAATMFLRVLGYTSSDVSGVYPNAQLALYDSLDLDKNVDAKKGDNITRANCQNLFYNLFNTKTKSGQVYAQTLGYSLDASGNVDIYKIISDKLEGPFVIEDSLSGLGLDMSKLTVYRKDKAADVTDIKKYDVVYYSKELNTVWAYTDKVTGTYEDNTILNDIPQNVTVSGRTFTFENNDAAKLMSIYGEFEVDDTVTLLLGRDGRIVHVIEANENFSENSQEFLSNVNDTLQGPYLYLGLDTKLDFVTDNTKFIKDSKEISASSLKAYDVLYYSKIADTVWAYSDAVTGKYKAAVPSTANPQSITVGSQTFAVETDDTALDLSFAGKFEIDDIITVLLGRGGEVAFAVSADDYTYIDSDNILDVINDTIEGPFIVTGSYASLGLPETGVKIVRNDADATASDVKKYDVVYYSSIAKTVLVYGKSVSGTYMSASPSVTTPAQITVAGQSYAFADAETAATVSSIGAFRPGDLVTLLLGKNDEIALVLPMSEYAANVYGVITQIAPELYTNEKGGSYSANTVTVLSCDGSSVSVKNSARNFEVGDIVKVSYGESERLEHLDKKQIEGTVTSDKIGSYEVAPDIDIIDLGMGNTNPVSLFFSRLTGAKLSQDDVLFYATNNEGKITDLILRDFSGDMHTYGVMITAESGADFESDDEDFDYGSINRSNYTYEYQVGTHQTVLNVAKAYTTTTGPSVFKYDGNSLEIIDDMPEIKGTKTLTNFGFISKDKLYMFSDNMVIYTKNTNKNSSLKYSILTVDELIKTQDNYNIRAYYDKAPEKGGRVRIILANPL